MNPHAAPRSRDSGREPLGVVTRDPSDRKVAEKLTSYGGCLSFQGLVEPGLIFGDRQIPLGERLTEADIEIEIGIHHLLLVFALTAAVGQLTIGSASASVMPCAARLSSDPATSCESSLASILAR
jgi:hypothetical protein